MYNKDEEFAYKKENAQFAQYYIYVKYDSKRKLHIAMNEENRSQVFTFTDEQMKNTYKV